MNAVSSGSTRKSKRRSCDRCHRCKDKCVFDFHEDACKTCRRLGLACMTLRPQARSGRRPKAQPLGLESSVLIWDVKNFSISSNTSQWLLDGQELLSRTSSADDNVPSASPFDDFPGVLQQFSANFAELMFGSSFAPKLRAASQHSYLCSPTLLQDIYTVISTAFRCGRHNKALQQQKDVPRGTRALRKLREASVTNVRDAFAVIALGQALAGFELITQCVASMLILRYSLYSIKLYYGELSINPSLDPVTITPVFWDTISCLIKREVPIVKFVTRDTHAVDHLAGLCSSLLPIFYDLCLEGDFSKRQNQAGPAINVVRIASIQQRLLSWRTQPPVNFKSIYSAREAAAMERQASMYRSAGLLLAHRNLYPLGTHDDVARSYADSIMREALPYTDATGHGIAFPLFLAAMEIPNIPRDVWKRISLLTVAPTCATKISALVEFVWESRKCGYQGFLLDLIDSGPDFVIVP